MMDSRVRSWSVQYQSGMSSRGLSYGESREILKQAKLLGIFATAHPEIISPYKEI